MMRLLATSPQIAVPGAIRTKGSTSPTCGAGRDCWSGATRASCGRGAICPRWPRRQASRSSAHRCGRPSLLGAKDEVPPSMSRQMFDAGLGRALPARNEPGAREAWRSKRGGPLLRREASGNPVGRSRRVAAAERSRPPSGPTGHVCLVPRLRREAQCERAREGSRQRCRAGGRRRRTGPNAS